MFATITVIFQQEGIQDRTPGFNNDKLFNLSRLRAMPGLILHLLAGCTLYFIGRYYYRTYFQENNTINKKLLLALVCLTFNLIPDIFLGIYYTTHLLTFQTLLPYHIFTHLILSPIAIGVFIVFLFRVDIKRKSIWIMGIWALILHISMDLLIQETSLLI